jgi:hypothetical protein
MLVAHQLLCSKRHMVKISVVQGHWIYFYLYDWLSLYHLWTEISWMVNQSGCWIWKYSEISVTSESSFKKIDILCLEPLVHVSLFPESTTYTFLFRDMVTINYWYVSRIIRDGISRKLLFCILRSIWRASVSESGMFRCTWHWCRMDGLINNQMWIKSFNCSGTSGVHIHTFRQTAYQKQPFHKHVDWRCLNPWKFQDWYFSQSQYIFIYIYIMYIRKYECQVINCRELYISM